MADNLPEKKTIIVRIEKISEIAENTVEIVLAFNDDSVSFKSGQYIWLELLKLDFPDIHGDRRAFSIASSPEVKGKITLILRKSDTGYNKTLISLPIGSEVRVIGPYGSIFLAEDSSIPVVFVAGGVGISPFLSIISHEINRKSGREMELFYFNDNEKRTAYLQELKKLSQENPSFKLHILFGRPEKESMNTLLKEAFVSHPDANWYVGGPRGLVDSIGEIILEVKIPKGLIHYEENYPSSKNKKEKDVYFLQPDMFKQAVAQSSNHIIFTDENGIIEFANSAAERLTGYSFAEMFGQTPRLWGGLMEESMYEDLWNTIKVKRQSFFGKIQNHRKDGTRYFALAHISPIISPDGELLGFVGTEEDISELENLDRAKSEFISLAAHQLRTPVTALNWYLEMLGDKESFEKLTDKQKNYLNEITRINKHQMDLVNTLLDVSRLELGKTEFNPVDTDLVDLMKSIISELKPEIEKKKIVLSERYGENLSLFKTDPKITSNVFQNLMTNAIKYIPASREGNISVSIEVIKSGTIVGTKNINDDSILITIADNGIGIPLSQTGKIFSRMFRADNARESEFEGNGLGLYMVKKIIDTISGDIWFTSEEGKGSTFYVTLPLVS